jgi:hypothetical protein
MRFTDNVVTPRNRATYAAADFVERVLSESEELLRYRFSPVERGAQIETILEEECQKGEIDLEEIRVGSQRDGIPRVRSEIVQQLVRPIGMSLAEVVRLLGVFALAISKILGRSA